MPNPVFRPRYSGFSMRSSKPSSRAMDHEERPEDEDDYSTYAEKYSDYD